MGRRECMMTQKRMVPTVVPTVMPMAVPMVMGEGRRAWTPSSTTKPKITGGASAIRHTSDTIMTPWKRKNSNSRLVSSAVQLSIFTFFWIARFFCDALSFLFQRNLWTIYWWCQRSTFGHYYYFRENCSQDGFPKQAWGQNRRRRGCDPGDG